MNKLSFFKGVLIASVLSVVFWVGAAVVIFNFDDGEPTHEQIEPEELQENTYALL